LIVVDASVVIATILDPRGPAADAVAGADGLAAPELLDLEVAQEVRGRVAGSKLRDADGLLVIRRLRQLGITLHGHRPLLDRIWELRNNLTAYDASYAALAESLGANLVTGDSRLAKCPGLRCTAQLVRTVAP
jgi:predicted nucleic acid-binding protein